MFSEMQKIPSGIWVLGFVSMLMDISSEIIHSLLPLFIVRTLGIIIAVGFIKRIAKALAPAFCNLLFSVLLFTSQGNDRFHPCSTPGGIKTKENSSNQRY